MSSASHTLGPECRLARVCPLEQDAGLEGIPSINAQFFYSSPNPIDDPLSTAATTGPTDTKPSRTFLRPFSAGDNNALERAWLQLAADHDRRNHALAQRSSNPSPAGSRANAEKLAAVIQTLVSKHKDKHDRDGQPPTAVQETPPGLPGSSIPVCCPELLTDASAELRKAFCAVTRRRQQALDQDQVLRSVMTQLQRNGRQPETSPSIMRQISASVSAVGSQQASRNTLPTPAPPQRDSSSLVSLEEEATAAIGGDAHISDPGEYHTLLSASQANPRKPVRPPTLDDGISGKPFVRVETEVTPQSTPTQSLSPFYDTHSGTKLSAHTLPQESVGNGEVGGSRYAKRKDFGERISALEAVEIPVGVSRLHMVSLPVLQMKPIYWSPVNDIAIVMRATWFYRDSMTPIEPAVANQLEAGYRELRPWTETWADEIRSALEVGPAGEERVSHHLWPGETDKHLKGGGGLPWEPAISSDTFCAARCFRGEASAEGTLEPVRRDGEGPSDVPPETRSYANHHVLYTDAATAFLLKPSLKPSAYYGRKPLAKIMRGITVGSPVVRGFDRRAWDLAHEKRRATPRDQRASLRKGSGHHTPHGSCPGCLADTERGRVTDLVLVVHGIGQKFAERVESFHFTHAINAFRRAINTELGSDTVQSVVRDGLNGIMVLPVNWRHNLSFAEGGPMKEEDRANHRLESFTLRDIEPNTIPAVRSMISNIMFDIPFYMSHHKPKMIAALVGEANRVYRLWCRNNPGFTEKGRVHLIGHSLGSAMAIEVLSRQPNTVPRLDLAEPLPEVKHFEFDTTNLFLLGSPAGFFLLLERGNLRPRRGRLKPGADPEDTIAKDVAGELGSFGCIAVDNIYNILAKEDPIAYLLNGAVDPGLAASLKTAYVPGVTTSILKLVSDAVRSIVGAGPASDLPMSALKKPPAMRLPSQLELEVHDFTREEVAEKKVYLLNDNGQIDYYLRPGGGPLEIQYLNMLSAHTSYWSNQDLLRFLCIEIGREPGRANTLPSIRAAKVSKAPVSSTR